MDPDGRVTVRVLHDGTNSWSVNSHIKVRDADCSPTASDIKRMLHLKSEMGLRMVGSTTDTKSAHRLIQVSRRHWRHLGCRIRPSGDLHFNRVQTFGISSASTYFAWGGSSLVGLVRYVAQRRLPLFVLLLADFRAAFSPLLGQPATCSAAAMLRPKTHLVQKEPPERLEELPDDDHSPKRVNERGNILRLA